MMKMTDNKMENYKRGLYAVAAINNTHDKYHKPALANGATASKERNEED